MTKSNRILDLSLKTSTLFDGSQKSMPTGIINKGLLPCNIWQKSLLGKVTGEPGKLQTMKAVELSSFCSRGDLGLRRLGNMTGYYEESSIKSQIEKVHKK